MQTVRTPNSEPLPGYRLVERLGAGGFGEVWKCTAPGGLFKAVKFVSGHSDNLLECGSQAEHELRALQRVKAIRHPFLLSMDRVEVLDGDLLVVMELADQSLHDLLQAYRAKDQAGIPRAELLGYLREAAEALDVMNQEHGLQHLDVKPRNLFLVGQHLKVGDFGLVNSLTDLQTDGQREAITPLYAAPEIFLGRLTPFCDQYSLAITYHELLTGVPPFTGKTFRQLALQHVQGQPDLTQLTEADQAVVARALAKEPSERFASCQAFVSALQDAPAAPAPRRTPNTRLDLCPGELGNTTVVPRGETPRAPAPAANVPATASSFVPGHQLLDRVGTLPVGEVWKARNARGEPRLVKLVTAPEPSDDSDSDPLTILRSIRHDRLMPLEVLRFGDSRLALITDPGEATLADRLKECQRDGLPGIPRPELLRYLRQAAEALDALQQTCRLQHLGLNPRQLVLAGGELRILDFGLAELWWLRVGLEPVELNTRYAAPELFTRQSSRAGDQYSLALLYQELLTGVHPFRNLNQRQMATARLRGNPDVGLLPGPDRPIILRALQIDPDRRYSRCTDLVAALEAVSCDSDPRSSTHSTRTLGNTISIPLGGAGQAFSLPHEEGRLKVCPMNLVQQVIAEEVAAVAGSREFRDASSLRYTLLPGQNPEAGLCVLEARLFGRLLPGTARLKLKGFQEQWKAERLTPPAGVPMPADPPLFVYRLRLPARGWQRWLGRQPTLEVRVQLQAPATTRESLTEVVIQIHPRASDPARGAQWLTEAGPLILDNLHKYLQLNTERRRDERFPYGRTVQVHPVLPTLEVGPPFVAQGKDISPGGLGLVLPCQPPSPEVYLQFATGTQPPIAVPAHIVRVQPLPDGRIEAGLCFRSGGG